MLTFHRCGQTQALGKVRSPGVRLEQDGKLVRSVPGWHLKLIGKSFANFYQISIKNAKRDRNLQLVVESEFPPQLGRKCIRKLKQLVLTLNLQHYAVLGRVPCTIAGKAAVQPTVFPGHILHVQDGAVLPKRSL